MVRDATVVADGLRVTAWAAGWRSIDVTIEAAEIIAPAAPAPAPIAVGQGWRAGLRTRLGSVAERLRRRLRG